LTKGKLALVLHAHLPYVRSAQEGSLEEDWYFQALLECYLPLLKTLEKASNDKNQSPKITISLSPTLLALLQDQELNDRFPKWLEIRKDLLINSPKNLRKAADCLSVNIKKQFEYWDSFKGDLITRFSHLQNSNVVDLLTCAATHGYLPLLRENPETVRGQLKTAVREHLRVFGSAPGGIWLPECAYYEGLDELMRECNLRYSILDGHGILHSKPRPRYGVYAPICTKNGVAFFGRDSDSTLPVWSSKEGYPGDGVYREFHKDLGWDFSIKSLQKIGLNEPRPLGLKLHRITSQEKNLEEKVEYEPELASDRVKEHAKHYLVGRKKQLQVIDKEQGFSPLLVAPFDAELFGHWWYEGPSFIAELFIQAHQENIEFTTLKEFLQNEPKLQLCEPCPSSWGQGGFHKYWLNESNSWIIPELSKAGKTMIELCSNGVEKDSDLKIIQQAARELLLSQSSDWSFIIRAGTTTKLAKERINRHLDRFWRLARIIKREEEVSLSFLSEVEFEDCIFPIIQANDWSRI